MGKGPSKKDYAPSAASVAAAGIAKKEWDRFTEKYQQISVDQAKDTQSGAIAKNLRGRGGGDVQKALSTISLDTVGAENPTGKMAAAIQGQNAVATAAAVDRENSAGSSILAQATKLGSRAVQGLSEASRLATSSALQRASDNEAYRKVKMDAAVQLGSAVIGQGVKNLKTVPAGTQIGVQDFFTPHVVNPDSRVDAQGKAIDYHRATGWERYGIGGSI